MRKEKERKRLLVRKKRSDSARKKMARARETAARAAREERAMMTRRAIGESSFSMRTISQSQRGSWP
jgi:hypothetical protein